MDIRKLADWHKSQHYKASKRLFMPDGQSKSEFHLRAAVLLDSLCGRNTEKLLAEVEIDVKQRAIESLEKLAKRLLEEAKDIRRMVSEDIVDE